MRIEGSGVARFYALYLNFETPTCLSYCTDYSIFVFSAITLHDKMSLGSVYLRIFNFYKTPVK